jgi:phosphatidylserine/phosphatidylglycerophosphate/cardiolipin synthase-like enzyme
VVKAIDAAQNTVLVSAYILSDHRIVRALERAAAQHVAVYVLMDKMPYGIIRQPDTMFSLLRAAGVRVRWSPTYFAFSHAKFMVLDDETLILSSANFSQSGFKSDRDFVIIDGNPLDVREADNIFRADWDRIAPVLNDPELLVSPVNSRVKLSELVAMAKRTVDLYSEEVLDRGMVSRLIRVARRGVRARVLAATIAARARRALTAAGVQVGTKSSAAGFYIHAKAVVVDDRLAFVGSENLSATSLDQNRELGLVIRDPSAVHRLERTFARDWSTMAHS